MVRGRRVEVEEKLCLGGVTEEAEDRAWLPAQQESYRANSQMSRPDLGTRSLGSKRQAAQWERRAAMTMLQAQRDHSQRRRLLEVTEACR